MKAAASARPLRVLIYVRLSVFKGQDDPTTSPARQEESCRAYCLAKGWEVIEVVKDLDVSGRSANRDGLKAVRAMFPEVDVVIFARLDRLARNVKDFMEIADEARQHDVALVSVAESLDLSTPSGRFVATILSAFAAMESDMIGFRVAGGWSGARALGRWPGGPAPYGLRTSANPNGPGRILVPDAAEAAIVREVAGRLLDNQPPYRVALDLNERGTLGRKGKPWTASTIARAVTNPNICGRTYAGGGELLRDDDGLPRQVWEPVLDVATWQRLQAVVVSQHTPQRPEKQRRERRARLLSGVVVCGECGRKLHISKRSDQVQVYVCSSRRQGLSCPGVTIRCGRLEEDVTERFLGRVGALPEYREVHIAPDDTRRADMEARLADLGRRIGERGVDRAAIAAEMDATEAALDALPAVGPEVRWVKTGRRVADGWTDPLMDDDWRRELLTAYLDAVEVRRGRKGSHVYDRQRVGMGWNEARLAALGELAADELVL